MIAAYMAKNGKTFKAIQVKVPANEAISLEDELKAKGYRPAMLLLKSQHQTG